MHTETHYVCDVCGAIWKDEPAARNCEQSHANINSLMPMFARESKYPTVIQAGTTDGQILYYVLTEPEVK